MSRAVKLRLMISVVALACAALLLTLVRVPLGYGAFIPSITASKNTVNTQPYFTCLGAATDPKYRAGLLWSLGETSGTTANDSSGNGTRRNGTYSSTGVSYNQATTECPRDSSGSVFLNSSNGGMIAGSTGLTTNPPTTFSEEAWFRTSSKYGYLLGFGNNGAVANGTNSTQYDRNLYFSTSGQLYFGVYNPNTQALMTIATPTNVANGVWHHVVSTFSSSTGMRLYIDGVLVNSDDKKNAAGGYNSGDTIYFRVGYDNLVSWPNSTSNQAYFNGNVAFAGYYNTVLSADLIAAHYQAGI